MQSGITSPLRQRPPFAVVVFLLLSAVSQNAWSQAVEFTGHVISDFPEEGGVVIYDNQGDDVGLPPHAPVGAYSGWNVREIHFNYDEVSDVMSVGVACDGICGDADGDGGDTTSDWLREVGGTDVANLGDGEIVALLIDTDRDYAEDDNFEATIGVGIRHDVGNFGAYETGGESAVRAAMFPGTALPNSVELFSPPSHAAPDLEFHIGSFSTLPGLRHRPGQDIRFHVMMFMASWVDAGIGEDFVGNQRYPILVTVDVPEEPTESPRDQEPDELTESPAEVCAPIDCDGVEWADSDGDGLTDSEEEALGTRPDLADTDGDGLSDWVEVTSDLPLDPTNPDTDGDGLCDGTGATDLCGGGEFGEDQDGDGDRDEGETSPVDTDTDDDGLGDGDELLVHMTDPLLPDSDDDGLQDGTELGVGEAPDEDTNTDHFEPDHDTETTTDPNSADTDGGGLSDGVEDNNHNGRVDDGETDPLFADDDDPCYSVHPCLGAWAWDEERHLPPLYAHVPGDSIGEEEALSEEEAPVAGPDLRVSGSGCLCRQSSQPSSSNAIWIIFIGMAFGWRRSRRHGNREVSQNDEVEPAVSEPAGPFFCPRCHYAGPPLALLKTAWFSFGASAKDGRYRLSCPYCKNRRGFGPAKPGMVAVQDAHQIWRVASRLEQSKVTRRVIE